MGPGFVQIDGFDCRVWYSRWPPQCSVCHESGHRAQACPLSGLVCRRCCKPGHRARECVRAWRPSSSAVRATVSSDHSMERKEEVIPPSPVVSDFVLLYMFDLLLQVFLMFLLLRCLVLLILLGFYHSIKKNYNPSAYLDSKRKNYLRKNSRKTHNGLP